ncbi:ORF316 [White spot syndrome virus]|uniref:ORF316 n=1 Tax=White spot syndrome virus TaxID=342409 RepID=A0A2D3I6B7_9VIRU|nr:ORF316 [White spot syndrome virus]
MLKVLWREQKLPLEVSRDPFLLPHLLLQLRIVKMMKEESNHKRNPQRRNVISIAESTGKSKQSNQHLQKCSVL